MTHEQAFHTSCREGLRGVAGFQTNAASVGLNPEQIAAIESAHARYDVPPDAPYEPSADDIRGFPIALRSTSVPGVGRVVSCTRYVGREYRGRDGAPDEGRFGNFFCHMVVGSGTDDPFDGCRPIELWQAAHWTTDESPSRELPTLGPVAPGPLRLEDAVDLAARHPDVAMALLDGVLDALAGGPPVLIVGADSATAATWIAWIAVGLPSPAADQLAFSTYERRPEATSSLHVMATTPACDPGESSFARLRRIDVAGPVAVTPSLYARVAARVAPDGVDRLADAVRRVHGEGVDQYGASLAISAASAELVTDAELAAVLVELRRLTGLGRYDEVVRAMETLPGRPTCDAASLRGWLHLHAEARRPAADEVGREIAAISLKRMAPQLDELRANDIPELVSIPTAPGVSGLGAWLREVEAAGRSDRAGRLIEAGARLGLIGVNVPVDKRIVAVLLANFDAAWTDGAIEAVAANSGNEDLVAQLTIAVIEQAGSRGRIDGLLRLVRYEGARRAARRYAADVDNFDAHLAWQKMRVALDPRLRADAARVLAPRASDDDARAEVRALWGPTGPTATEDVRDLLEAYLDADVDVPQPDVDRGYRALMAQPLRSERGPNRFGRVLERLPLEQRRRPAAWAWVATAYGPEHAKSGFVGWAGWASHGLRGDSDEIPDDRWSELVEITAHRLVKQRADEDVLSALRQFRGEAHERVCEEVGRQIAIEIERDDDSVDAAAREFGHWLRLGDRRLLDLILPAAFERLSGREVDRVAEALPEADRDAWLDWAERHPRLPAHKKVARALRLGRRGAGR